MAAPAPAQKGRLRLRNPDIYIPVMIQSILHTGTSRYRTFNSVNGKISQHFVLGGRCESWYAQQAEAEESQRPKCPQACPLRLLLVLQRGAGQGEGRQPGVHRRRRCQGIHSSVFSFHMYHLVTFSVGFRFLYKLLMACCIRP